MTHNIFKFERNEWFQFVKHFKLGCVPICKVAFNTMSQEHDIGKPTYKSQTSWPQIMKTIKNGILVVDIQYVLDATSKQRSPQLEFSMVHDS